MKSNFQPTPEMIRAAETVCMTMAFTATVRPIVREYETRILKEMKPLDRYSNEVITDPEHAYSMSDEKFLEYFAACKKERDAAGLVVEHDDNCPLLVAEDLERKAKNALIDAMAPVTNITHEQIFNMPDCLENHKKLVDLCLNLLVPFCDKEKILKRVQG